MTTPKLQPHRAAAPDLSHIMFIIGTCTYKTPSNYKPEISLCSPGSSMTNGQQSSKKLQTRNSHGAHLGPPSPMEVQSSKHFQTRKSQSSWDIPNYQPNAPMGPITPFL
ncbi:hypothetical protein ACOSP7_007002 [Xanthoceras sorbifolium]